MITTIDSAGRLVVPKSVREQARIRPGQPLDVRYEDGRIEIEPRPISVRLKKSGEITVAVPNDDIERLSAETVRRVRRSVRLRHGR